MSRSLSFLIRIAWENYCAPGALDNIEEKKLYRLYFPDGKGGMKVRELSVDDYRWFAENGYGDRFCYSEMRSDQSGVSYGGRTTLAKWVNEHE